MAIRRVTGAVSPSELIFADANALGATYDGSGTTIERGETFTLPAGGTTAVSNGALRLEALKGDCTITNNGNSTLTNASGVDGTIIMRSGASDFPAFVRNSSMGSMSTPAREDFTGSLLGAGTFDGTLDSSVIFPAGSILQVKQSFKTDVFDTQSITFVDVPSMSVGITPKFSSSKILIDVRLTLTSNYWVAHGRLMRDSTEIAKADTAGNRSTHFLDTCVEQTSAQGNGVQGKVTGLFLDSPTIPSTPIEITYKVQISNRKDDSSSSPAYHAHVNKSHLDRNTIAYDHRATSSITVMEIAQ